MQRLHVVGFTQDNQGLILSVRRGTRTGAYTVDVDSAFEEALTDLMKERGADAAPRIPRAESQLSVREMQQRLRSGQSIRQVARAAGVDDDWVARFAVPIQAEQSQVVRQAFGLVMSKQRLGTSSQSLGTSVWWNLQDRSVQLDEEQWSDGWSAALLRDSRWVVKFEYEARKRKQVAEWEVDLKLGAVTSRNRLGSDLGYVESGRRRRPGPPPPTGGGLLSRPAPPVSEPPAPEPVVEGAAPAPTKKKAAARRAPAKKKPAAKKTAAKKTAAKKTAAKKAPVKTAAARKASPARKATATKRAPAKKKSAAAKKKAPAKKRPAAKRVAAMSSTPTQRVAVVSATNTGPLRPPAVAPRISGVRALPVGATPPISAAPAVTPAPQPSTRKRRGFLHR
ncbi:MAG: septation protein SepH [Acidimicrobiales bacterium]|nr:septation protein SepH [Acidimicrobiales bacterium]